MATIYYEPSACNCDGTDYTKADIDAAATQALALAKAGKTVGMGPNTSVVWRGLRLG